MAQTNAWIKVFRSCKCHIAGCQPDFPKHRNFGCNNCEAAFYKNTPRNRAALGGLVPWQWPEDEEEKKTNTTGRNPFLVIDSRYKIRGNLFKPYVEKERKISYYFNHIFIDRLACWTRPILRVIKEKEFKVLLDG